ncbi:MAG: CPXCG motif-containing cysteine-rich protein [Oceanospirillaceae bacterium]|jgi:hypothetical protein|uniref:CPXCG motif-containing cysteine-rich protein n=1 Tax=Marinobacterium litorale TaxID=404770 RepID=UPI000405C176|nr:CPXCG motif-containing cysteine-rich protein [Marinobacterium litorale]MBS98281.1 CPXCG motif-containing cysteine-rich protein [Oceanospirillaceae bacterium]
MNPEENVEVGCPWCSELISLRVECIEPEQEYIEDCPVCCAPMLVRVEVPPEGFVQVDVEREGG